MLSLLIRQSYLIYPLVRSFQNEGSKIGGEMGDLGPAELLAGLCHTDEQNPFPVWQNGHISPCFNQLVLGTFPHAVMAIFSACYLGMRR